MVSGVATRVRKSPAEKQKRGSAKASPGSGNPSLAVLFNLETAVGCARVRRDWRVRQGVTTKWACAHKAEQRSLTRQARCNRVHSAVTCDVTVIEAEKVNAPAAFLKFASGQLRFLGLRARKLSKSAPSKYSKAARRLRGFKA
jgi:hypothetical protein